MHLRERHHSLRSVRAVDYKQAVRLERVRCLISLVFLCEEDKPIFVSFKAIKVKGLHVQSESLIKYSALCDSCQITRRFGAKVLIANFVADMLHGGRHCRYELSTMKRQVYKSFWVADICICWLEYHFSWEEEYQVIDYGWGIHSPVVYQHGVVLTCQ